MKGAGVCSIITAPVIQAQPSFSLHCIIRYGIALIREVIESLTKLSLKKHNYMTVEHLPPLQIPARIIKARCITRQVQLINLSLFLGKGKLVPFDPKVIDTNNECKKLIRKCTRSFLPPLNSIDMFRYY